jgi:hypothetical protein
MPGPRMTSPFGRYWSEGVRRSAPAAGRGSVYYGGDRDRSAVLGESIRSVMTAAELALVRDVVVFERPSREVNAYAGFSADGRPAVVTNHALFGFAYRLLRIWQARAADAPALVAAAIRRYFPEGDAEPDADDEALPRAADGDGATLLRFSTVLCMELFVLCHEFAHHLRGHVKRSASTSARTDGLRYVCERSRSDEDEADATGLELYERVLGLARWTARDEALVEWVESTVPQAVVAFDVFFSMADLAARMLGEAEEDSHPPALVRRARVRTQYFSRHPHDGAQWALAESFARFCAGVTPADPRSD